MGTNNEKRITILELLNKQMQYETADMLIDRYSIMRNELCRISSSLDNKDASDISEAVFVLETIISLFDKISKKEDVTILLQ